MSRYHARKKGNIKPCAGGCGKFTWLKREYCVDCLKEHDVLEKQSIKMHEELPWWLTPETSQSLQFEHRPFQDDAMSVGLAIREKLAQVSL